MYVTVDYNNIECVCLIFAVGHITLMVDLENLCTNLHADLLEHQT